MAIHLGQLLVNYSAADVRVFFRIYFIVLGTTIVPLGKACSSSRVRLSLSKGKNVGVTKMLGWLGGLDCITTIWRLRAFPSGALFTFLMVVAYFVSIASDLVGSYIRSVQVHDQCTFGTGLVLSPTRQFALVPWNGYPYTVVSQAQVISLANDGQQGIYAKVNQATSFSAGDSDIVGTWQCTQNSLQLDYSTDESPYNIAVDLVQHDLLYSSETVSGVKSNATQQPEHLVFVDTSNNGVLGVPWDIRVSASTVDTNTSIFTMLSFQCTLNDGAGWVTNILKGIQTSQTIPDWIQVIQGSCYSGTGTSARPDLSSILERMFNSMVMIAGGGNYLLDTSQATATQGCLTNRVWILWEVLALAALAALLNIFLVMYLLLLKTMEWKSSGRQHSSATTEATPEMKKDLKHIPGDLLAWTAQAVQESRAGTPIRQRNATFTKPKDLKNWKFGLVDLKNQFGILDKGDRAEEVTLLVHHPK